ncbi:MAG: hypothetical protein JRI68_09180 [Deltaproteobacteria bacterium]|nr:hypothetical protein [Deltaproteobacteria bacterium]
MGHPNLVLLAATLLVPAFALTAHPVQGKPDGGCARCKPRTAYWQWKANGYAVGLSAEAAEKKATEAAIDSACEQSKKYLAPRKLTCRPGCTPGEITESCGERKPPECLTGTHAENRGMWQFVCRKMHGKEALQKCTDAAAKEQPGYGMCDVKVTATKQRACTAPDC